MSAKNSELKKVLGDLGDTLSFPQPQPHSLLKAIHSDCKCNMLSLDGMGVI